MKKLCTYLTLFVLGLLALAQPVVAKDYTFYFRLPDSGWSTPPGFHWWNCGNNANVDGSTTSPVAMKPVTGESNLYSVTLKNANETGGNIMFKTNGSWNPQTTAITELKDGYIYEITGGSYQDCTCEPKEEYTQGGSVTKMYIRGVFTGTESDWGNNPDVMMPYNEDLGLYYYEPSSTGDFMISTTCGTSFWDGRHQSTAESGKLTLPDSKPESQNIKTGGGYGRDLTLPALGTIYFDKNEMKIWYEPKQETLPTELWAKGPGASGAWDKTIKLESDGNGLFHFTAYAADKFVISDTNNLGNDESGNSIFDKTAWGPIAPGVVDVPTAMPETANVEHVHQFENDFRATATNVIWFDAKNLKLWSGERILPTLVFEAGKAYYVDASAVAKDGNNWFENDNCTLGVKYDGHVHFGGTIVKVSSDPLVYRFTVDEDQTEIVVGRRNNQGLHDAVTVQAPTDGSNCIFLDGSSDELVLDHLGTYSPAGGLYILGSSNAIDGDWKSATPIAMNYDATKDVFYYMVQGTNASADDPIKFLISRGATNSAFFNAANAFEPVRDGYIHMAEPSYMKGKPGYTDGNYFKLISRGRVMAKYIKAENSEEITGLKIWYEPVVWPDLYALGSIIAKPGDKKSELGDQTSQWHTFVKLEKDEKQPGLYYYDLGCGDKETKDLFNKEDYEAEGVFGKINEIGHFNFSFLSGTVTGEFWKDAFVPAVGQGMGTLNRDGVPVPFQYRDSDPGRYDREGGWTSTNFVFGERCRIWVDVVRQIVWVQPIVELSDNQVVFDFWDKGGKKYPDGNKYKWWSTTDKATRFAQVYIKDATLPEGTTLPAAYRITAEDLSWMSEELENGEAAGARYHFVASLPTDFFEADGKTVIGGGHLWVRIKNGDSGSHEMLRPYAYQATYTQGPESDPDFNKYGNILAKGDPIVTIEPSVNMIYADVEAPKHLGSTRSTQVMHYPYVNQFTTDVTVNPDDVYPFHVQGLTEPTEIIIDGNTVTAYKPVAGAPFKFKKSNQVTVNYGSIKETYYGDTGMATITGIDHANAKETDKMDVRVTYTSEGLIFARTKEVPLKRPDDELQLPIMKEDEEEPVFAGFYGGGCSEGLSVDLIVSQKFAFPTFMINGGIDEDTGKEYTPRAAYLGYEVSLAKAAGGEYSNDHSHVFDGQEHMAKNGVPLMWDFKDDNGTEVKAFEDPDNWHYEAFTGKRMAIQLHHVFCGKNMASLPQENVEVTVKYHLYVPVATEYSFKKGSTSQVRGKDKASEAKAKYTGPISADIYGTHTVTRTFGVGNITTGVEGVGVEDAPVEFYNLQGVRMTSETLAPGIYIRRQGNETSKVYIR